MMHYWADLNLMPQWTLSTHLPFIHDSHHRFSLIVQVVVPNGCYMEGGHTPAEKQIRAYANVSITFVLFVIIEQWNDQVWVKMKITQGHIKWDITVGKK